VSIENANNTIQILSLSDTHFSNRGSVRIFWNLVGLKELHVFKPVFASLADSDSGDDEEDPDCWAEFIRRNKNISEVWVVLDHDSTWDASAMGIVNGACGHESLKTLFLECRGEGNAVGERAGDQLYQLLQGNKTLKTLTLESTTVTLEGGALLAEGLFLNMSLQSIGFRRCTIPCQSLTTIVQWLLVNQTLNTFDLMVTTIEGGDAQTICHLLSRVFRQNTSLTHIHLPMTYIDVDNMNRLVGGLVQSKTIENICFFCCSIEYDAWSCLERALLVPLDRPNKTSITSITLPEFSDARNIKSFLRNLPLMAGIKEVDTWDILDEEDHNLLLHAAKEKQTLLSFTRHNQSDLVTKEIDFYLKLNWFGRHILDSTTVRPSLWPILLGRMSSDQEDVDALFFFLREYFSNYRGGANRQPPSLHRTVQQQPQQQRRLEQASRPCKFARLDE
jgi:hypothetical protein